MTTATPNPDPTEKAYALVTWQTIEKHVVRLTASRLAELLQVTPAEVTSAGADNDLDNELPMWLLCDALAEVERPGETSEGCRREDIELRLLCERCEEPVDDLDPDSGLCRTCQANNASRVAL